MSTATPPTHDEANALVPSPSKARPRSWRRSLVAAVYALGLIVPLTIIPAWAEDDRDSVARAQEESANRVEQIKHDMEGIDSTLAQVYLELDSLRAQIPVAENELSQAQDRYDAANRTHQAALGQLETATAEKTRIAEEIEEAEELHDQARAAIGELAREMYRGGAPSPVMLAMSAEGSQGIAERAAAAEALARSQNTAISSALNIQERQRNQATRQQAITDRISDLEAKARSSAEEARNAQQQAEAKVIELSDLKKNADAKQTQWEAKKQEAARQLDKWQAEYDAMSAKLAKIDEENRAQQRIYSTPSGGSSGFYSPLRIPLVMTSPFGWRHHPVLGTSRFHNGTDFAANCGTPIYPSAPGVVSAVTFEEAGGNVVYVNHGLMNGSSWMSAYVHMEGTNVYPGQAVGLESVLGWVGTTGYSTGCHLHLSFMQNGADVDPMDFL